MYNRKPTARFCKWFARFGETNLEISNHVILLVMATITVMMSMIMMLSSPASETTAATAAS